VSFGGKGVAGHARTPGFSGVEGVDAATSPGGFGVTGVSAHGTALYGTTTDGLGLHVNGQAKFKYSGLVFISPGQETKTVSVSGLTSSNLVLLPDGPGSQAKPAYPVSASIIATLSCRPRR